MSFDLKTLSSYYAVSLHMIVVVGLTPFTFCHTGGYFCGLCHSIGVARILLWGALVDVVSI